MFERQPDRNRRVVFAQRQILRQRREQLIVRRPLTQDLKVNGFHWLSSGSAKSMPPLRRTTFLKTGSSSLFTIATVGRANFRSSGRSSILVAADNCSNTGLKVSAVSS